jgi:cell division inhibitor SulA
MRAPSPADEHHDMQQGTQIGTGGVCVVAMEDLIEDDVQSKSDAAQLGIARHLRGLRRQYRSGWRP